MISVCLSVAEGNKGLALNRDQTVTIEELSVEKSGVIPFEQQGSSGEDLTKGDSVFHSKECIGKNASYFI